MGSDGGFLCLEVEKVVSDRVFTCLEVKKVVSDGVFMCLNVEKVVSDGAILYEFFGMSPRSICRVAWCLVGTKQIFLGEYGTRQRSSPRRATEHIFAKGWI